MKRRTVLMVMLIIAIGLWGCERNFQSPVQIEQSETQHPKLYKPAGPNAIAGQYIVVFQDGISDVPTVAHAMAKKHAATVDFVYRHTIKGFATHMSAQAATRMANDSRVKYITPDYRITVGPPVGINAGRPGSAPAPQVTPWGVTRVGGPLDGTGKTAWIIDTGIDLDNPDLNVDVDRSVNFVTTGRNSADDQNGHGTHVAGTIAALDNDIDVVGVAAGATVVAVRVLDRNGSGDYSWVIAGVDYVANNAQPGDVANMSLGGPIYQPLDDAILAAAAKGINFSLAAGNDSDDANNYSPARVNGDGIYTISAIDNSDVFAWFSNYGNPPVDFAAPGVDIASLALGGGVTTMSGTSMATPHVAGILLLGPVNTDGYAIDDPDGNPDPIAHF